MVFRAARQQRTGHFAPLRQPWCPSARGCRARTHGRPTSPATPCKSGQLVAPSEERVTRGADKPSHPAQLRSARQAEQGGPGSRQAQPPPRNAPHARTREGRQAQPPCPGAAASRQRAGHFAPPAPAWESQAKQGKGNEQRGGADEPSHPRATGHPTQGHEEADEPSHLAPA